jgi:hypothetical protein
MSDDHSARGRNPAGRGGLSAALDGERLIEELQEATGFDP